MKNYTIYSNDCVWKESLEKWPELKELAIKCDLQNNPKKAEEIKKAYQNNFLKDKLTDDEKDFARKMIVTEMAEQSFFRK